MSLSKPARARLPRPKPVLHNAWRREIGGCFESSASKWWAFMFFANVELRRG